MEEAGSTRTLVNRIRRRQFVFIDNKIKTKDLEQTPHHYGKAGRESRRQRDQMMDSLAALMDIAKTTYTVLTNKNRGVWKGMLVKVLKQGT